MGVSTDAFWLQQTALEILRWVSAEQRMVDDLSAGSKQEAKALKLSRKRQSGTPLRNQPSALHNRQSCLRLTCDRKRQGARDRRLVHVSRPTPAPDGAPGLHGLALVAALQVQLRCMSTGVSAGI